MYFRSLLLSALLVISFQVRPQQILNLDFNARFPASEISTLTSRYLGFDIYAKPFSIILSDIEEDPDIRMDTTIAATATSLFYIRAYHKEFNPFKIELDSVRLIIAENVNRSEGRANDTVFLFQMEGLITGKEKMDSLPIGFKSMSKQVGRYFDHLLPKRSRKKDILKHEFIAYYKSPLPFPFVTIGWRMQSETRGNIIISFMVPASRKLSQ